MKGQRSILYSPNEVLHRNISTVFDLSVDVELSPANCLSLFWKLAKFTYTWQVSNSIFSRSYQSNIVILDFHFMPLAPRIYGPLRVSIHYPSPHNLFSLQRFLKRFHRIFCKYPGNYENIEKFVKKKKEKERASNY